MPSVVRSGDWARAGGAGWRIARHAVDLAHDTIADLDVGRLPWKRVECLHHADELMAQHALKAEVAFEDFQVGVENAGACHADQRLARRRIRPGMVSNEGQLAICDEQRAHDTGSAPLRFIRLG